MEIIWIWYTTKELKAEFKKDMCKWSDVPSKNDKLNNIYFAWLTKE